MNLGRVQRIGTYAIESEIGRGATGTVFRAVDDRNGQAVALKTLTSPSVGGLMAMRREIGALARLNHPQIVRIVDHGVQSGAPWYAMTLVHGTHLRDWIAPTPPPHINDVLLLFARLLRPLAYLHGEGLVHQDLKPENILVTQAGIPIVVDFGLTAAVTAKIGRDALPYAASAGTLSYMSPEQIRRLAVDPRADIYALGCILYELLTGAPPFSGTADEIIDGHLRRVPPRLTAERPGLPLELDRLVSAMLAKARRERPGYCADIELSLRELGVRTDGEDGTEAAKPYLFRPDLAGREAELARLASLLDAAHAGTGAVVLLGGESGVGKTRLALELARRYTGDRTTVIAGGAAPETQVPLGLFAPFLELLADRCIAAGSEAAARLLGPGGGALTAYEPRLTAATGLDDPVVPSPLPPREARLRLFSALAHALSETARSCTVLLIADDVQWSDELSLAAVRQLLEERLVQSSRILLLLVYRAEEAGPTLAELLARGDIERVALSDLQEPSVTQLVSDVLAVSEPPQQLLQSVSDRCHGNPYFIAELLRLAVECNMLARDRAGQWCLRTLKQEGAGPAADLSLLPLPTSLGDAIRARLEALPEATVELLDVAAVIGRTASLELLCAILNQRSPAHIGGAGFPARDGSARLSPDEGRLRDRLDTVDLLIRRHLLQDVGEGGLRFVHDAVRVIRYSSLPSETRARLHARVADALEAEVGLPEEAREAELAHHRERAGEADCARAHYLRAARWARDRWANDDAEKLYNGFLRLVFEPTETTILVRNEFTDSVLIREGRYKDAAAQYRLSLDESRKIQSAKAEGRSLHGLGNVLCETGEMEAGKAMCELALELQRSIGDRSAMVRTLNRLAIVHHYYGQMQACAGLYREAAALAKELGDEKSQAVLIGNLGTLLHDLGDLREARGLHEQAVLIKRATGDRRGEGISLCNIGMISRDEGDLAAARRYFEQALVIHREIGDRENEGWVLSSLASIEGACGSLEVARTHFRNGLRLQLDVADLRFAAGTLHDWAVLERRVGTDLAQVERLIARAVTTLQELGDKLSLARCLCERGHCNLARGGSASVFLQEALQYAAECGVGPQTSSDVGQALARLTQAQEAFARGEHDRLRNGELIESYPPGLRQISTASGKA
ncbi:MAG: protein kinase [Candidatus Schekmanbacteria bacterium]|nr:protein kinase [Candidatus Schekmanbacteria bacterium]